MGLPVALKPSVLYLLFIIACVWLCALPAVCGLRVELAPDGRIPFDNNTSSNARRAQFVDSLADYFLYNVEPHLSGIGASLDQHANILSYGLRSVGSSTTSMFDLTKSGVDLDHTFNIMPDGMGFNGGPLGVQVATHNRTVTLASRNELVMYALKTGPWRWQMVLAISAQDVAPVNESLAVPPELRDTVLRGNGNAAPDTQAAKLPPALFASQDVSILSVSMGKDVLVVTSSIAPVAAADAPFNVRLPGGNWVTTFRRCTEAACDPLDPLPCFPALTPGDFCWRRTSIMPGIRTAPTVNLAEDRVTWPAFNASDLEHGKGIHVDSQDGFALPTSALDEALGLPASSIDDVFPLPSRDVLVVGQPETNTVTTYISRQAAISILQSSAKLQADALAGGSKGAFDELLSDATVQQAVISGTSFVNPVDGSFVPLSAADVASTSLRDRICVGACVWPPEWVAFGRITVNDTDPAAAYAASPVATGSRSEGGAACGWTVKVRAAHLIIGCPGLNTFSTSNTTSTPQYIGIGRAAGGAVLIYDLPFYSSKLAASIAGTAIPHGGGADTDKITRNATVHRSALDQQLKRGSSRSLTMKVGWSLVCRVASDFTGGWLGSALAVDSSQNRDYLVVVAGAPRANRILYIVVNAAARSCVRENYATGFRMNSEQDVGTSVSYLSEVGYFGSPSASNTMLVASAQEGRLYVKAFCMPNRYIVWPFPASNQLLRFCANCAPGRFYKGADAVITSQTYSLACAACPAPPQSVTPQWLAGLGCIYQCGAGYFGRACEPASVYVRRNLTEGGPIIVPAGSSVSSIKLAAAQAPTASLTSTLFTVQSLPANAIWVDDVTVYAALPANRRVPLWRCSDGYSLNVSSALTMQTGMGSTFGFGVRPNMLDTSACSPPPPPDAVLVVRPIGIDASALLEDSASGHAVASSAVSVVFFLPKVSVAVAPVTTVIILAAHNASVLVDGTEVVQEKIDRVEIPLSQSASQGQPTVGVLQVPSQLRRLQIAVSRYLGVSLESITEAPSWFTGQNLTAVVVRITRLRAATKYRFAAAGANVGGPGPVSSWTTDAVTTLQASRPSPPAVAGISTSSRSTTTFAQGLNRTYQVRSAAITVALPIDLGGSDLLSLDLCVMLAGRNDTAERQLALSRLGSVSAAVSAITAAELQWSPDELGRNPINTTVAAVSTWMLQNGSSFYTALEACDILVASGFSADALLEYSSGPLAAVGAHVTNAASGIAWYMSRVMYSPLYRGTLSVMPSQPGALLDLGCGLNCRLSAEELSILYREVIQQLTEGLASGDFVTNTTISLFDNSVGASIYITNSSRQLVVQNSTKRAFEDAIFSRLPQAAVAVASVDRSPREKYFLSGMGGGSSLLVAAVARSTASASLLSTPASFTLPYALTAPTVVTGVSVITYTAHHLSYAGMYGDELLVPQLGVGLRCRALGPSSIELTWGEPTDPGGAAVSYHVIVATDALFSDVIAFTTLRSLSLTKYGIELQPLGQWVYADDLTQRARTAPQDLPPDVIGVSTTGGVLEHAETQVLIQKLLASRRYYVSVTPFNVYGSGPSSSDFWGVTMCDTPLLVSPQAPALTLRGVALTPANGELLYMDTASTMEFALEEPRDAGGSPNISYWITVSVISNETMSAAFGLRENSFVSEQQMSRHFLGTFASSVGTVVKGKTPTFSVDHVRPGSIMCISATVNTTETAWSASEMGSSSVLAVSWASRLHADSAHCVPASTHLPAESIRGCVDTAFTQGAPPLHVIDGDATVACFQIGVTALPSSPGIPHVVYGPLPFPDERCYAMVSADDQPTLICSETDGRRDCAWGFISQTRELETYPAWLHPYFNHHTAALLSVQSERYRGLEITDLADVVNTRNASCAFQPVPLSADIPIQDRVLVCNSSGPVECEGVQRFIASAIASESSIQAMMDSNSISSRRSSPSLLVLRFRMPKSDGGLPIEQFLVEQSDNGGVSFSPAESLLLVAPQAGLTVHGSRSIQSHGIVRVNGTLQMNANVTELRFTHDSTFVDALYGETDMSPGPWIPSVMQAAATDILPSALNLQWPFAAMLVTGLAANTGYVFRVTAATAAGASTASEKSGIIFTGPTSAPSRPFGLRVESLHAEGLVSLCWSAPLDTGGGQSGHLRYDIYAAELSSPAWCEARAQLPIALYNLTNEDGFANLTVTAANDTSPLWFTVQQAVAGVCVNVTGLQAMTEYTFAVVAASGAQLRSGPSRPSRAVSTGGARAPLPPLTSKIVVTAGRPGSLTVTWPNSPDDGGSPLGGYRVFIAEVPLPSALSAVDAGDCDALSLLQLQAFSDAASWLPDEAGVKWIAVSDIFVDRSGNQVEADASAGILQCSTSASASASRRAIGPKVYSTTILNLKAWSLYGVRISAWSVLGGLGAPSTLNCSNSFQRWQPGLNASSSSSTASADNLVSRSIASWLQQLPLRDYVVGGVGACTMAATVGVSVPSNVSILDFAGNIAFDVSSSLLEIQPVPGDLGIDFLVTAPASPTIDCGVMTECPGFAALLVQLPVDFGGLPLEGIALNVLDSSENILADHKYRVVARIQNISDDLHAATGGIQRTKVYFNVTDLPPLNSRVASYRGPGNATLRASFPAAALTNSNTSSASLAVLLLVPLPSTQQCIHVSVSAHNAAGSTYPALSAPYCPATPVVQLGGIMNHGGAVVATAVSGFSGLAGARSMPLITNTSVVLAWWRPFGTRSHSAIIVVNVTFTSSEGLTVQYQVKIPLSALSMLPAVALLRDVSGVEIARPYKRMANSSNVCAAGQYCAIHVGIPNEAASATYAVSLCANTSCSAFSTIFTVEPFHSRFPITDIMSTFGSPIAFPQHMPAPSAFMVTTGLEVAPIYNVTHVSASVTLNCTMALGDACTQGLLSAVSGICWVLGGLESTGDEAYSQFWRSTLLQSAAYVAPASMSSTCAERAARHLAATNLTSLFSSFATWQSIQCGDTTCSWRTILPVGHLSGVLSIFAGAMLHNGSWLPMVEGAAVDLPTVAREAGFVQPKYATRRQPMATLPMVVDVTSTSANVHWKFDPDGAVLPAMVYILQLAPVSEVRCNDASTFRTSSRFSVCEEPIECIAFGRDFNDDGAFMPSESTRGVVYGVRPDDISTEVIIGPPTIDNCSDVRNVWYSPCLLSSSGNSSVLRFQFRGLSAATRYSVRVAVFDAAAWSIAAANVSDVYVYHAEASWSSGVKDLFKPWKNSTTGRRAAKTELTKGWSSALQIVFANSTSRAAAMYTGLRPFTSWSEPFRTNQPVPPRSPQAPQLQSSCNTTQHNCTGVTADSVSLEWQELSVNDAGGVPLLQYNLRILHGVVPPIALQTPLAGVLLTGNALPTSWLAHAWATGVLAERNLEDFEGSIIGTPLSAHSLPFSARHVDGPFVLEADNVPRVMVLGLLANSTYVFATSALNAAGESAQSPPSLSLSTLPPRPPAPASLAECVHPSIINLLNMGASLYFNAPAVRSPSTSLLVWFQMPLSLGGLPLSHVLLRVLDVNGSTTLHVLSAADVIIAGDVVAGACSRITSCPATLIGALNQHSRSAVYTRISRFGAVLLTDLSASSVYTVSVASANAAGVSAWITTSSGCTTSNPTVPSNSAVEPAVMLESQTASTIDLVVFPPVDDGGNAISGLSLLVSTDGVNWSGDSVRTIELPRSLDILREAQLGVNRAVGFSGFPGSSGASFEPLSVSLADTVTTERMLEDWYNGAALLNFGARNISTLDTQFGWDNGWDACAPVNYRAISDLLRTKFYGPNILDVSSPCSRYPSGTLLAADVARAANLSIPAAQLHQGSSGDGDICAIAAALSRLPTSARQLLRASSPNPVPIFPEDIFQQLFESSSSVCSLGQVRVTQLNAAESYAFRVGFTNAASGLNQPDCAPLPQFTAVTTPLSAYPFLASEQILANWLPAGGMGGCDRSTVSVVVAPTSMLVQTLARTPPGQIQMLQVQAAESTAVQLAWFPPSDLGGAALVGYRVEAVVDGVLTGDVCSDALIYAGFNATAGFVVSLSPAPVADGVPIFVPADIPAPSAWRDTSWPPLDGPVWRPDPRLRPNTDPTFDSIFPFKLVTGNAGAITPSQYLWLGGVPPEVGRATSQADPYGKILPFAWALNSSAALRPSAVYTSFTTTTCVGSGKDGIAWPSTPSIARISLASRRMAYRLTGLPAGSVVRVRISALTAEVAQSLAPVNQRLRDDTCSWNADLSSASNGTANSYLHFVAGTLLSSREGASSLASAIVYSPPAPPGAPSPPTLISRNASHILLRASMPSHRGGCALTKFSVWRRIYILPILQRDIWQRQLVRSLYGNDTALPGGGWSPRQLVMVRDDDISFPVATRLSDATIKLLSDPTLASDASSPLVVVDQGLRRATTYEYVLHVGNRAGWSGHSDGVSATTSQWLPGPPVGVRVPSELILPVAVQCSWSYPYDDGGAPILSYRVDAKIYNASFGADAQADWVTVATTSSTSIKLSDLAPSVSYMVRVTAFNLIGAGISSPPVLFRTKDPYLCPGAPDPTNDRGLCSGHGTCHAWDGTCQCDAGYAPPGCMFMDGITWEFQLHADHVENITDTQAFVGLLVANIKSLALLSNSSVRSALLNNTTDDVIASRLSALTPDRLMVLPGATSSSARVLTDSYKLVVLLQLTSTERDERNALAHAILSNGGTLDSLPTIKGDPADAGLSTQFISDAIAALASTAPEVLAGMSVAALTLLNNGQSSSQIVPIIIPTVDCDVYDSCSSCLSRPECSWCAISGACRLGTKYGSISDQCPFSTPEGMAPIDITVVDADGQPLSSFYYHSSILSRSSCPANCAALTSCSACAHRADCAWCEDSQQCASHAMLSTGALCGNDTTSTVKLTADAQCPDSRCPRYLSRWTCTLDAYCGYCDGGGWPGVSFCAAGDSFGFTGALIRACTGRYYFRSTSITCPFKTSDLPDCQSCISVTGCGWCASTAQCGYASLTGDGPALGYCPATSQLLPARNVTQTWFSAASPSLYCPAIPLTSREVCSSLTDCAACLRTSAAFGCSFCDPSAVSDPGPSRCMLLGDAVGLGSPYGYTGSCPAGAVRGMAVDYPYFNTTLQSSRLSRMGCAVSCDVSTPLSSAMGTVHFGSVGDLGVVPQVYRRPAQATGCTWMVCPLEISPNGTVASKYPEIKLRIEGWDLAPGDALVVSDGAIVKSMATAYATLRNRNAAGENVEIIVSSECVRVELIIAPNSPGGTGFKMSWNGIKPTTTDLMMILMIVIVSVVVGGFVAIFTGVKLSRRIFRRANTTPFTDGDTETLEEAAARAQRTGRGAPDFVVSSFPVFLFDTKKIQQTPLLQHQKHVEESSHDTEGISCAICLAEFEDDDEVKVLLCRHAYHCACIDQWLGLNKRCPTCRRDVARQYMDRNARMEGGEPDPLSFGADIKLVAKPVILPPSGDEFVLQNPLRLQRRQRRAPGLRSRARAGMGNPIAQAIPLESPHALDTVAGDVVNPMWAHQNQLGSPVRAASHNTVSTVGRAQFAAHPTQPGLTYSNPLRQQVHRNPLRAPLPSNSEENGTSDDSASEASVVDEHGDNVAEQEAVASGAIVLTVRELMQSSDDAMAAYLAQFSSDDESEASEVYGYRHALEDVARARTMRSRGFDLPAASEEEET